MTSPLRIALLALGFCLVLGSPPVEAQGASSLPDVLLEHGFDDPTAPITVVFVAPIGEAENHPKLASTGEVAPPDTFWVFEDPAPVRAVLAKATTSEFSPDRMPGTDARMVVYAGREGAASRIYLTYSPGWGIVKKDRKTGGEWHFAPAADRQLVDLLSRTPPTGVGWTPLAEREAAWKEGVPVTGPDFGTLVAPADWGRLVRRVVPRDGAGELRLPEWFDWEQHFAVVAWAGAGDTRDRLDGRGARFSVEEYEIYGTMMPTETIRWRLSAVPGKEEADDFAPVRIGFFRRPEKPNFRVELRLDGKLVKNEFAFRMQMPGQTEVVAALYPRSPAGVRLGVVVIHANRTWRWEPDGGDREGRDIRIGQISSELWSTLRSGLGQWKAKNAVGMYLHDVRIAGGDTFPPGTKELLRLAGVMK
jgi:hypothetical protein